MNQANKRTADIQEIVDNLSQASGERGLTFTAKIKTNVPDENKVIPPTFYVNENDGHDVIL